MWSIGIVLLLGLLVQLSIDCRVVEASSDEISFRASVRNEALHGVASCVHAFSQVELINLHASEPIVIRSVATSPESISVVSSDKQPLGNIKVPQQIHVPHVSELTLGPKQIAVVPLTFLPRFPENDDVTASPEPSTEPGRTNGVTRSNVGYQAKDGQFEVHTNLLLDTSRGSLKLPIVASAFQRNGYGLPQVIYFAQGEIPPSNGPNRVMVVSNDLESLSELYDCFNVHLSNPSKEKELKILEVFVSRPDLISVYHNDLDTFDTELTEVFQSIQRSIDPGVSDEYVLTLCNSPPVHPPIVPIQNANVPSDSYLNDGLGYLQIRTDDNVLIVKLEQLGGTVPPINANPDSSQENSLVTLVKTPSIAIPSLSHVNVQLAPSVNETYSTIITFENMSPYNVRFAQINLVTPFLTDTLLHEEAKILGLEMEAKVGKVASLDSSMLEEILILTCSITPKPTLGELLTKKPFHFSGSVIIRTSFDIETTREDWRDVIKSDPHRDSNLTIEIPYEVTVTDPSLYLVEEKPIASDMNLFDALFFPLRRFEGRLRDDNTTYITHDLHIVSAIDRAIDASNIQIIDSIVDGADKWVGSLCRRFKLSTLERTQPAPPWRNSSMYDLGRISVTYNVDEVLEPKSKRYQYETKTGVLIDDGLVLPHTCYLSIDQTLKVKLILVPGKLDVTTSEFAVGQKVMSVDKENSTTSRREFFSPSLDAGFEEIIQWLRSSGMGPALKKTLKFIFNGRNKLVDTKDGTAMLAAYLANLCAKSFSPGTSLRPILLKVGAVVHDEVHTSFLFLTNHNPVAVNVSIDVGEVEGMSIALARGVSHVKGGTSSILDRLQKVDEMENEMIKKGRWRGHTRRGLTQFLLSSEFSQSFSASLQYRDDISLSDVAVKIQPLLRSLYKHRDVAHFHASAVPPHLVSSEASACPGLDLHPPGYDENSPNGIDSLLPVVMTDNLTVSRHLNVCHDANRTLDSHRHPPVVIPPGGVARFEVKVRCPPRHALHTDITPFLTTGLVLSTDHGQIMPIIATFEALLGHLHVSPTSSSGIDNVTSQDIHDEATVDVPAGLFLTRAAPEELESKQGILFEPHDARNQSIRTYHVPVDVGGNGTASTGVPLVITSSFARDVILKEIESCNPWFEVRLVEQQVQNEANATEGVATIHSVIPCQPFQYNGGIDEFRLDFPGHAPQFPSFYECALDWLQKRFDLQRRGCGLTLPPDPENSVDEIQELAVEALSQAVHYSLINFNDGVPRPYSHSSKSSGKTVEVGLTITNHTDFEFEMQRAKKDNEPNTLLSHADSKKSLPVRESPFVRQVALDLFAQLSDVWRLVAKSGLHLLSTNLRAKINYDRTTSSNSTRKKASETGLQTLSVAMQNVFIRTALEIPKLVDLSLLDSSQPSDPADPAILQFPPTPVAEVNAIMIPLRNPTSMPVRVRLAALGKPEQGADKDMYDEIGVKFLRPDVRDRYLKHYDSVFVQDGNVRNKISEGESQHWWEGGGAYFMPDDRGDLIQARYNLSITAGPGAHISLINPSLHAFNGLLMACGTRCGVREDNQGADNGKPGMVHQKNNQPMMKHFSPIGASSAAGMSLLGQSRPAKTTLGSYENYISAGGSTPADPKHLAFAIPYESLGEIVLPPYGTGELGPILFRPPGRYSVLGCDTAAESQGTPTDAKTKSSCDSKFFESLVFLENSLTGLERVVVRGRGMWERVVFLDPTPSDALSEAFGDVEYRYGRPTLVFPGSAAAKPRLAKATPLIKEIVVHNDGDTYVEFGHVYFSQSSDLHFATRADERKSRRTAKGVTEADGESSCQMRGFRLLDCSESSSREMEHSGARNLRHGFALSPGQNLSLFVEHSPDCTLNAEYVTLNFGYREEEKRNRTSWSTGQLPSRHRLGSGKVGGLSRRKIEILVGFDMASDAMASCVPISSVLRSADGDKHCSSHFIPSSVNDTETGVCHVRERRNGFVLWSLLSAAKVLLLCSSFLFAFCMVEEHRLRRQASIFFRSHLRGVNGPGQHQKVSASSESDWSAAFRCLARVDPLSSELQTFGREQARQLVLNRYKRVGAIAPHCISSAGVFLRDRAGAVVGASRRGSIGSTLAGSERRPVSLSDAIFKEAFTDQVVGSEGILLLPCSLGWRDATARGVLSKSSHVSGFTLKSRVLVSQRKKAPVEAASPESASFDYGEESFDHDDNERQETSVQIESEAVCEVKKVEDATKTIAAAVDTDEQKGDVISTSDESEITAAGLKEVETTPEAVAAPEAEATPGVDTIGFEKVESPKTKSHSRQATTKKTSEDRLVISTKEERTNSKNRNDVQADASCLSGAEQKVEARTKTHIVPQKAPRGRDGRGAPQDAPTPRSRGQVQNRLVEKNADGSYDLAKWKGKRLKNVLVGTSSAPSEAVKKTGEVLSPMSSKSISAPSSVPSSPSSPSSVGQVSVSSRSTTRSDDKMSWRDSPVNRKRAEIRPPPGLPPPPGFCGDEPIQSFGSFPPLIPSVPSLAAPASAFNGGAELPSLAEVSLPLGSSVLGKPLFPMSGEGETREPCVVPSLNSSPMSSSENPLTGVTKIERMDTSGFDVMDFLDSILEDRSSLENDEESLGDLLAENTSRAISAFPVSSDPWATERKSRASAYGINVEEYQGEDDDDVYKTDEIVYAILASANRTNGESTSSLQNSVPLLTPSAMLVANAYESEDPNNNSSVGLFGRSFYSSLLEE